VDTELNILIVDDDEVDRMAVRRHLEPSALPLVIHESDSATTALSLIQKNRIDCLLLDHILPGIDGLELMRRIRKDPAASPPIIMLTGHGDELLAAELMKAGAADYIPKAELSSERLSAAILGSIRLAEQQRQIARTQLALQQSEALNRAVLNSLPAQIAVLDPRGTVIAANESWEELCRDGQSPPLSSAPAGANYFSFCRQDSGLNEVEVRRVCEGVEAVLRGEQTQFSMEYFQESPDGKRWFQLSCTPLGRDEMGGVVSQTDITARKLAEEKLAVLALYDSLTGLPNRNLFTDRLRSALHRARRSPNIFAIIFLDLDDFKVINDSMGHIAGDELLKVASRRLEASLRAGDSVARLGGDEFVILLEEIANEGEAIAIAERIQEVLTRPVNVAGNEVFISASMGIVLSAGGKDSPDTLIRNADTAMYRAKAKGRTCFALFDQEMHASVVKLMHVKNDLWRAFRRNEFRVRYQPILSAASHQLVGFEALIRWQKGGREIVPDEFIRVAEESGQIIEIDRWVLRQVCRQIRAWSQSFPHRRSLTVSVNVSGKHLRQADFAGFIQHTLFETGADPGQLILEVTESSYLENPEQIGAKLMELKSRGLRLHIDDFGVGYSSFSYLCKLPADAIKIDRTFISALLPDSGGLKVVRAMVAVARSLNMKAVAEGVETLQQAALVTDLGCDYLQGFYFSRPLRVEAVEKLLAEGMLPRDAVEAALEAAV